MLRRSLNKWLFGPQEKLYNDGFDDLFSVAEDYEVPQASTAVQEKIETREPETKMEMDNMFDTPIKTPERKPSLKVVEKSNPTLSEVKVVEPRAFEDTLEIVNHLKDNRSIIVNLQYLDEPTSQRVIDFLSGATCSLDGTQQRVGHGVFIFAPRSYNIETETAGHTAYKDIFAKTFGI